MHLVNELKNEVTNVVQTIVRNTITDHKPLIVEYEELLSNRNKLTKAWLYKDLPRRDSPTFANTPRLFTITDLELYFIDCEYPTTCEFLYKVKKGVVVLDVNKLVSPRPVTNHIQSVEQWINAATDELNIIRHNLATMPEFTEQEIAVCDLMYTFDWWYSYSDDREVYRNGNRKHELTKQLITAAVEQNPSLKSIVEMVANAYGYGVNYFINAENS